MDDDVTEDVNEDKIYSDELLPAVMRLLSHQRPDQLTNLLRDQEIPAAIQVSQFILDQVVHMNPMYAEMDWLSTKTLAFITITQFPYFNYVSFHIFKTLTEAKHPYLHRFKSNIFIGNTELLDLVNQYLRDREPLK